MEVTLTQWHCNKCGYDWLPRVPHQPIQCPRCKNYRWNQKPKQKKEDGKEDK